MLKVIFYLKNKKEKKKHNTLETQRTVSQSHVSFYDHATRAGNWYPNLQVASSVGYKRLNYSFGPYDCHHFKL